MDKEELKTGTSLVITGTVLIYDDSHNEDGGVTKIQHEPVWVETHDAHHNRLEVKLKSNNKLANVLSGRIDSIEEGLYE